MAFFPLTSLNVPLNATGTDGNRTQHGISLTLPEGLGFFKHFMCEEYTLCSDQPGTTCLKWSRFPGPSL